MKPLAIALAALATFVDKVDTVIGAARTDGTLKQLSEKYFGRDYISKAARYDLDGLGQNVK